MNHQQEHAVDIFTTTITKEIQTVQRLIAATPLEMNYVMLDAKYFRGKTQGVVALMWAVDGELAERASLLSEAICEIRNRFIFGEVL